MEITLNKNIKSDERAVKNFMKLAVDVFDLSFEEWYEKGYWRDKYFPYTFFEGDKAIANVSASMIHTEIDGQPKLYIQIGTVMTDSAYRNQGLSCKLMKEVLNDWEDKCDGIYLYANDSVLDFYPKFGFVKAKEYMYSINIEASSENLIKLDMNKKEDIETFEQYYGKGNPYSDRPMTNNFGLVMFYCNSFMNDCVYYSKALDCIIIASYEEEIMTCYDIFGDAKMGLDKLFKFAAGENTKTVNLGFMPKNRERFIECEVKDEGQLFVYSKKENMFEEEHMMLPLLSHA